MNLEANVIFKDILRYTGLEIYFNSRVSASGFRQLLFLETKDAAPELLTY